MAKRTKAATKKDEELITLVRDRYKVMSDADHDNRRQALEDI